MIRKLSKTMAFTFASLALGATLTFAGGMMKGKVVEIDKNGMATVQTEDGKEHKVKGEGWKVGANVQCEEKEGMTSCKAVGM